MRADSVIVRAIYGALKPPPRPRLAKRNEDVLKLQLYRTFKLTNNLQNIATLRFILS